MGHSKADKAGSHERIVRAAAARFREAGVDAVGLADLMKDAGLTHGGFYRHFGSREDLVAEAIERALLDGGQAIEAIEKLPDNGNPVFARVVDGYLSTAHRDGLATSCAVTTLAGDVARGDERVRSAYTLQVRAYLEFFGRLLKGRKHKSPRAKAVTALCTLVGALSLARAVDDEKLSLEILASAAIGLKAET